MPNGHRKPYRMFDEDGVENDYEPSCAHSSDSEETVFHKSQFWKHSIYWHTLCSIQNRRLLPVCVCGDVDLVGRIAAYLAPEFNGKYMCEDDKLARTTPGI